MLCHLMSPTAANICGLTVRVQASEVWQPCWSWKPVDVLRKSSERWSWRVSMSASFWVRKTYCSLSFFSWSCKKLPTISVSVRGFWTLKMMWLDMFLSRWVSIRFARFCACSARLAGLQRVRHVWRNVTCTCTLQRINQTNLETNSKAQESSQTRREIIPESRYQQST